MSKRKRIITVAGSGALAAVVAVAIQLGSSTSAIGSPGDTQTIDAKTNPTAAAQALSTCTPTNCKFTSVGKPTFALSEPRIIGDALYNCGGAEAEDIVALSDERSQSTSLEESLSAKASSDIIKFAVEAEVNSKQMDEVSTKTTQTNSVSVEPGGIGWTQTRVPVATVTGTYSITNGGSQVNVTNVTLTLPGLGDPDDNSLNKMTWTDMHHPMSDADRRERCGTLPPLKPVGSGLGASRPSGATLVICGRGRGCANRRKVTGIDQSIGRGTRVALVRGRVIYATGVMGKSGGVLRAQRPVRRGRYTLLLSAPRNSSMLSVKVR